jgi:two-component system sensor histidine kinase PhoQ
LRWGLGPLRRITADVDGLKRGELLRLRDDVPAELAPLTGNINILLDSEQRRRERVRNTVDRLTHTLKTPLMLLRNSEARGTEYRQLVDEQVSRILGIVEGELARARLDGRAPDILHQAVPVKPVLERIAGAYQRLPRLDAASTGPVAVDTSGIAEGLRFAGEERDLQDLFGSVLENAIRHCHRRVAVTATPESDDGQGWIVLRIGDDGDGIPGGREREILQRGARADTAHDGQGLGLSIALEIASAYGGSLHAGASPLGGASIEIRLPASATS